MGNPGNWDVLEHFHDSMQRAKLGDKIIVRVPEGRRIAFVPMNGRNTEFGQLPPKFHLWSREKQVAYREAIQNQSLARWC